MGADNRGGRWGQLVISLELPLRPQLPNGRFRVRERQGPNRDATVVVLLIQCTQVNPAVSILPPRGEGREAAAFALVDVAVGHYLERRLGRHRIMDHRLRLETIPPCVDPEQQPLSIIVMSGFVGKRFRHVRRSVEGVVSNSVDPQIRFCTCCQEASGT